MIHSERSDSFRVAGSRLSALASACAAACTSISGLAGAEEMKQWVVPLVGNAYLTSSAAGSRDQVEKTGIKPWQNEKSVFSIYFRTDRAAVLDLSLRLKVPEGESVIRASAAGSVFEKKITGGAL